MPTFRSRLTLLTLAIVAATVVFAALKPRSYPVAIVNNSDIRHIEEWVDATIPLPNSEQEVLVHIWSPLPFGVLDVHVDDCLQHVSMNERVLRDDRFPYCNWFDRITIDISGYSHVGSNSLTVQVRNNGGPGFVRVGASRKSWLFRAYLGFVLSSVAAFGAWWFMRVRSPAAKTTAALVIVGALLRIAYVAYTEYDTRAYDWDGHMEYIRFIADHWVLPVGNQGWEFHQQPLYYIFGGSILWIMRVLHAEDSFVGVMQLFSLAMSIGTLCAGAWIAGQLFPEKSKHAVFERFVFVGLVATLPNIVMLSSRLNNDVPTALFAFLTIGFLLDWWKDGAFVSWIIACVMTALALLTKSSSLPILALVMLAWILRGDFWKTRVRNALVLALLAGSVVAGTFIIRIVIQEQNELVPVWVSSGLHVENFPAAYYMFDPMQVLLHPFNDNWTDIHRRQYLWEYLFKSAFFGEWQFSYFRTQAVILLAVAMFLLPVGALGIIRSLRSRKAVDWLFIFFLLISLAALISFRYMHPNSSNQELRYISFVVIPIGYFLAQGMASIRYYLPFATATLVMFTGSLAFLLLAMKHSL